MREGGTYVKDPVTGEVTRVEGTVERDRTARAAAEHTPATRQGGRRAKADGDAPAATTEG